MSLLPGIEATSDLAIIVGITGIFTGLGGKYFFVIPLMDPPSGNYGKDAFNTSPPGVWNGPVGTIGRTSKNNLWTVSGIKTALTIELGLEIGTLGLNEDANTNYDGLATTDTAFSFGNHPGPMGLRSGWIFLGLLVGGVIVRGGGLLYSW